MSGLAYQHIKLRCVEEDLIVPWSEKKPAFGKTLGLSESGYDITIRESLTIYPATFGYLFLNFLHDHLPLLFPKKYPNFILASSLELFNMPLDLRAEVKDKSSWVREGLTVQNTVIEPGWKNSYLTLELKNIGENVIEIKSGMPIAQILFTQLLEPTKRPYNGKYQNQEARPIPARYQEYNGSWEE